eukprot:SRR837773.1723.p1 GENE.SRR837773.1723~~SRR837773.1723.p1  ORF type:complete len:432 (-),score=135.11 SRR837773.1723:79-1287(-)
MDDRAEETYLNTSVVTKDSALDSAIPVIVQSMKKDLFSMNAAVTASLIEEPSSVDRMDTPKMQDDESLEYGALSATPGMVTGSVAVSPEDDEELPPGVMRSPFSPAGGGVTPGGGVLLPFATSPRSPNSPGGRSEVSPMYSPAGPAETYTETSPEGYSPSYSAQSPAYTPSTSRGGGTTTPGGARLGARRRGPYSAPITSPAYLPGSDLDGRSTTSPALTESVAGRRGRRSRTSPVDSPMYSISPAESVALHDPRTALTSPAYVPPTPDGAGPTSPLSIAPSPGYGTKDVASPMGTEAGTPVLPEAFQAGSPVVQEAFDSPEMYEDASPNYTPHMLPERPEALSYIRPSAGLETVGESYEPSQLFEASDDEFEVPTETPAGAAAPRLPLASQGRGASPTSEG